MSQPAHNCLIDRRFIIRRPVDVVFAHVSNHENYADWYPGVISVVSRSPGQGHGVGTVYDETLRLPDGKTAEIVIRVVESEAPGRFATEGEYAPLDPRMEFDLVARPDGDTDVRWRFFSRNRSWLVRQVIRLVMRGALGRNADMAVDNLQRL